MTEVGKVSDAELARFLKQLAAVYKDKRLGNSALSAALTRLANTLVPTNDVQFSESTRGANLSDFHNLDAESVNKFLIDQSKSKLDLMNLASVRFSIPRGKLLRLNLEELREKIRAVLQNEESLKIITQEAERHGTTRKS